MNKKIHFTCAVSVELIELSVLPTSIVPLLVVFRAFIDEMTTPGEGFDRLEFSDGMKLPSVGEVLMVLS
jgi:hypothetical protein